MNINYTRKTSGYVAALLALVTIKVFFEALMLDRGPIPGLSFLFYTLLFYVHYAFEDIERLCISGYDNVVKQMETLKPIIIDRIQSEAYGEYIKTQYSSISGQVINAKKSLSPILLNIRDLTQSKIQEIRALNFESQTPNDLDAKSIWVHANSRIKDYTDVLIRFSKTFFTWIRAISNVIIRKWSNYANSLGWNEMHGSEEVVTKKIVDSSDDTT